MAVLRAVFRKAIVGLHPALIQLPCCSANGLFPERMAERAAPRRTLLIWRLAHRTNLYPHRSFTNPAFPTPDPSGWRCGAWS